MELQAIEVPQSPEDKFREFLSSRTRPLRFTDQQRDMVRFIFSRHDHFHADQLIDDLEDNGFHVSRATIYRTLTKLVDAGLLRRFEVGSRAFYEHDYGYPQHEHLYCEKCGKMIEFQDPALEELIREVAGQHGFHVSGHTFIIRGTCKECKTKRRLDLV